MVSHTIRYMIQYPGAKRTFAISTEPSVDVGPPSLVHHVGKTPEIMGHYVELTIDKEEQDDLNEQRLSIGADAGADMVGPKQEDRIAIGNAVLSGKR